MDTQYFERPEGTIAYDDSQGAGELVIMWPGMGALRSEYRYLAPALKGLGFAPKTAAEGRLGQVQAPALVVMGTKDPD